MRAEKHAHMDANKHANLRAKWDVNKGNVSSKQKTTAVPLVKVKYEGHSCFAIRFQVHITSMS